MKKKVLKGSLLVIVLLIVTICGLFVYSKKISKIEVIENAKNTISKLVADTTAVAETSERGLIEIKDISKPQNISTNQELKEVENIVGRYQFNTTGCGVIFSEGHTGTYTGYSHIPICAIYEENYGTYIGNSSGGYLDKSYNEGGKIYKAYLVVEFSIKNRSTSGMEEATKIPVTLLYGGEEGTNIISGIKSTLTNIYDTQAYEGKGWIDVTEFVKENGYGWYYGCNIPYSDVNGNDEEASWKLIVIEENDKIPVRKLALSIGNLKMRNSEKIATISGNEIRSKKNGNVTGQMLFGVGDVDPIYGSCSTAYFMEGNSYTYINTSNSVRTKSTPLRMIMSRNGIPLKNRAEWDNHYYYTKDMSFTTTYNDEYYELTGNDFELFDVDGSTDKHNIVFENDKASLNFRMYVGSYTMFINFLGLAVDIDVPEYISTQTLIGHDTYYATINGTITNSSTETGVGIHDGKVVVLIDKGLKVLSTNAYFTTSSGQKINLTEDMYTIDTENNTITYTFGKDSNGTSLNGESLIYTVETQAIDADNVDGKKYIANNEVYVTGKLTNNNVETEHYMDKVVWDISSVTIGNPPYEYKEKDINYIVEYYKNGIKVEEDTQNFIGKGLTVNPVTTVDKTQINLINKYKGYKFEKIEIGDELFTELPNEIEEGKIIKVYYKRKELVLSTEVNLTLANGRGGVELDWSDYDPTDTYFVIYRKEENQTEWKKIVDLDDKLSSNSYIDILGNDKAKPVVPTVEVGADSSDIQINLSSSDTGTIYTYYIEAYDISTNTLMKTSNSENVKI